MPKNTRIQQVFKDKEEISALRHDQPDVLHISGRVCVGCEHAACNPPEESLGVELYVHLSCHCMNSELIETISLLPWLLLHFNVDSNDHV